MKQRTELYLSMEKTNLYRIQILNREESPFLIHRGKCFPQFQITDTGLVPNNLWDRESTEGENMRVTLTDP